MTELKKTLNLPLLSMKQKPFLLLLTLFLTFVSNAQFVSQQKYRYELKIGGGPSFYYGDLGEAAYFDSKSLVKFRTSHISYQFNSGVIFNVNQKLALSGEFTFGKLEGSDQTSTKPSLQNRNVSFFTPFYAFDVKATNTLWDLSKNKYSKGPRFDFYGILGAGVMRFDPRGMYKGRMYRLQPLGTEGQFLHPDKSPYRLITAQVEGGLGLRMTISEQYKFGIEGQLNYTFTDYLDDVSGTYAGYSDMLEARGDVAAHFSDPSEDRTYKTGQQRGSPELDDYFILVSIYFTRSIGNKKVNRFKTFSPSPKPYWRKQENAEFPSY